MSAGQAGAAKVSVAGPAGLSGSDAFASLSLSTLSGIVPVSALEGVGGDGAGYCDADGICYPPADQAAQTPVVSTPGSSSAESPARS
ncbi:MAG: hypothetical protein ACYC1Z_03665 [Georgenia sp.]